MNNIQRYCKDFRESVLNLTLSEVSTMTGTKLKTISAFEHGRSNNINHVYVYLHACVTDEQVKQFNHGFINALNGDSK